MKILLTNSPAYIQNMEKHFSYGRFGCSDPIPYSKGGKDATDVKDHYNPYPWSLGYASALLKRDSKAKIIARDAQARDYNEYDFKEEIRRFGPDVLVVELPTISFGLSMEILKELKDEMNFSLIVTGLHVSGLPLESMQDYSFIDYIIVGDYGIPLLKFANMDFNIKYITEIPNLFYRTDGIIKKSDAILEYMDFDSLPYPDRDDLPIDHYHDFEVAGKPTIHMVTSRGCPFGCSYCNARVFWPKGFYWKRSVKNIVDEMQYVKEKYGAKQIYFDDDIMTFDRQRMVDFANEILKRNFKLPWTFMGDINIDEDLMKLLVKANARGLKFGVESINPKSLKSINKSWVSEEKVINFVKMCKKYGLWAHGDFIVGLPDDTKESVEKMLDFALSLDLDSAQIYSAQPLPGTPFYEQVKNNGWLVAKSWDEYDGNYVSPVSYPWFKKEEIEEMMRRFKREWEFMAIHSYMRSPKKMIRYVQGRGLSYTLKKVRTILKNRKEGHIFVAGT